VVTDKEFWQQFAACRHADPDLFFPISSSGRAILQVAAAKAFGCSSSEGTADQ
jgi:hypothetical protein